VVLGGLTILDAGTAEQKKTYLPRIGRGEALMTLALTETDAQYAASSVRVRAEAIGNTYTLNGPKLFVPDAHIADQLLVVARTNQQGKAEDGITVFVVDAGSPGMSHSLLKTIAGDKQCEVVFNQFKVPADRMLGGVNQGWGVVQRAMEKAAVAKCCEMVGIMQRVVEMTVSYAKERKQFGRPIGSFQAVQHYCANMASDVDGARFSTYQAAWRISEGMRATREVAIAKAWMSETFSRVITLAHQVHGAIGCTIDHELQYYTKRGKAGEASYGDSDFYREIVARQMGL
jgi:alkylation response protein AidB-like acyl-CoA dehydrogenase